MEISIAEMRALSAEVMSQRGLTPIEVDQVLDHLLDAELAGRPSHGLVRVIRICKMADCDAIYVTGAYARQAALAGFVGIVTCNSDAAVAPYGSIDPIMGTNPLAIAIPTGGEPIMADLATAKTTYGDVILAMKTGQQLEPGLLIDKNGQLK